MRLRTQINEEKSGEKNESAIIVDGYWFFSYWKYFFSKIHAGFASLEASVM